MRPSRVERLELAQQRPRLADGGRRRRIEEAQAPRDRATPQSPSASISGARSASRISGSAIGRERAGLGLVPQPVADARLDAAGAAAALVGGGLRHAHRAQLGQAARRVVARHARQAAVDHHAHALDGQAGLGDGGGQHHLAPAGRRRLDRPVLHLALERADRAARGSPPGRAASRAARVSVRRISRAPGRKTSRLPVSSRSALSTARPPPGRDAGSRRGRDSGSRPGRRGPRSRPPAHRRAASPRARRRASPT